MFIESQNKLQLVNIPFNDAGHAAKGKASNRTIEVLNRTWNHLSRAKTAGNLPRQAKPFATGHPFQLTKPLAQVSHIKIL